MIEERKNPGGQIGLATPPVGDDSAAADSGKSASPPVIPTTPLNRYEVQGEIGRGGMGIVHKARDRETGETVALKVLKPEVAADPALFERFVNELRLARKITHKNVCRIYDFSRLFGTACISMEFVDGESLRQVLRRYGSLSVRKAVAIVRQICAGLREAHAQGIVHRDLKPENVMLDRAGNVKLMDFGIARCVEPNSECTTVMGTPAYMAPEQFSGLGFDHRVDIYALGLILYEILTATPTFQAESTGGIVGKQLHDTPARPGRIEPSIPPEVEAVVLKCLEKDPRLRYQTVDELLAALDVPASSFRRTKALRPAEWVLAGGLAAAGLVGAFWLGWNGKPMAPPVVEFAAPAISKELLFPPLLAPAPARPEAARAASSEPNQPAQVSRLASYKFELQESSDYSTVGPVRVRLNKADRKRQMYTVTVEMNDNRIELRDRALFEPVRISHHESHGTLELVVSKIEDNQVQGHLSAPRSLKPLKPVADEDSSSERKRSLFSWLPGR